MPPVTIDHDSRLNLGCSGSHNPGHGSRPRLVGLWIVPNYLWQNAFMAFRYFKERPTFALCATVGKQLNTLQTVVPIIGTFRSLFPQPPKTLRRKRKWSSRTVY